MLQQAKPEDYVIATGEQHSVKEFIEIAAQEIGLEVNWRADGAEEQGIDQHGRTIVAVDPRYFRPAEVETLLGDFSKARANLGWVPKISFKELVSEMIQKDLTAAERELAMSQWKRP